MKTKISEATVWKDRSGKFHEKQNDAVEADKQLLIDEMVKFTEEEVVAFNSDREEDEGTMIEGILMMVLISLDNNNITSRKSMLEFRELLYKRINDEH